MIRLLSEFMKWKAVGTENKIEMGGSQRAKQELNIRNGWDHASKPKGGTGDETGSRQIGGDRIRRVVAHTDGI